MKEVIDHLVDINVPESLAGGVLIEGFQMTTFSMRLVSQGVYTMLEHGSAHLLRYPSDVVLVPNITECLIQMRELLQPTVASLKSQAPASEQTVRINMEKNASASKNDYS